MNWDATTDSRIQVIDSVTIAGYRFSDGWARGRKYGSRAVSLVLSPKSSPTPWLIMKDGRRLGTGETATFLFPDPRRTSRSPVATALSPTSEKAALANLDAESPTPDFDRAEAATQKAWNDEPDAYASIQTTRACAGLSTPPSTIRSSRPPYIATPTAPIPARTEKSTRQTDGPNYSTFSTWDTYRAAHPLYTVIDPERAGGVSAFAA